MYLIKKIRLQSYCKLNEQELIGKLSGIISEYKMNNYFSILSSLLSGLDEVNKVNRSMECFTCFARDAKNRKQEKRIREIKD